jgi:hypothetical protein
MVGTKRYRAEAICEINFTASFVPMIAVYLDLPDALSPQEHFIWAQAALEREAVKRGWPPAIRGPITLAGPLDT